MFFFARGYSAPAARACAGAPWPGDGRSALPRCACSLRSRLFRASGAGLRGRAPYGATAGRPCLASLGGDCRQRRCVRTRRVWVTAHNPAEAKPEQIRIMGQEKNYFSRSRLFRACGAGLRWGAP